MTLAVLVIVLAIVCLLIGYTMGEVFTDMRWEHKLARQQERIAEFVVMLDGELRRPQNGPAPSHGGTVVPIRKEDGKSAP